MNIITDGLLIAGTVFAGTYCFVLGRRLRTLMNLRSGVGGAIVGMTRALEDARRALEEAKTASRDGNRELRELVARAESVSGQLRILLAATRDLPPAPAEERTGNATPGEADTSEDTSSPAVRPELRLATLLPSQSAADDPAHDPRLALGPAPLPVVPRSRKQTATAAESDPAAAPADRAAAQG